MAMTSRQECDIAGAVWERSEDQPKHIQQWIIVCWQLSTSGKETVETTLWIHSNFTR